MATILILCTGNSCRSHMGEGLLQHACGTAAKVISAGSDPAGYVHPLAVKVMGEIGIDISANTSKHLSVFDGQPVDVVITVCDNANKACPFFPAQKEKYHWSFPDPAKFEGTEEEILVKFRTERDDMAKVMNSYAKDILAGTLKATLDISDKIEDWPVSKIEAVTDIARLEALVASPSLTVVEFFAPWCKFCRNVAPHVEALVDSNPSVQFLRVDVTVADQAVMAHKSAGTLPTFAFFKNGGKVADDYHNSDIEGIVGRIDQTK